VLYRKLLSARAKLVGFALVALWAPGAGAGDFSALRLGAGPQNSVFTRGDRVVPVATVDSNAWYKVIVRDPSGAILNSAFGCAPGSAFATNDNGYVIQPADPLSTSGPYTFTIEQFANDSCSGPATESASVPFYVVGAVASVDGFFSGETTNRFAVGQTAFVRVEGMPPSTTNWSVTWILPSGGNSCANTTGFDRPDVGGDSVLPDISSFLAYPPNADAASDEWNKSANYDNACQSFTLANQGQWRLRLERNSSNFVVLPVFVLSNDCTAPVIYLEPDSQTVCAGTPVSFSVFATGTNLTYRWRKGGVNLSNGGGISGTATDTLTISSPNTTHAGDYDVAIVGDCGAITSAVATLTVNLFSDCSISGPATVCANSTGNSFSAPPGMAGYQWQVFGGGTIAGAADGSNVAVNVTNTGTFTLSLTFTNASGCATNCSRVISITQPSAAVSGNAIICAGSNATIQATLNGTAPWTVTWSDGFVQSNIVASPVTRTVSPANTTTFTIANLWDASCVGVASGSATITVNQPPTVSTNPVARTVCLGGSATFTAAAAGTAPIAVQWQISTDGGATFTNIPNATNATLTISNTVAADDGKLFRAVFQNGCGSATSSNALLTVANPPVCSIAGSNPVCANSSGNIFAAPAGMASYGWTVSGNANVSGPTNAQSISINALGVGTFTLTLRIVSSNGCSSVCSSTITNRTVTAVVSGSATNCPGSSAIIRATLTGIAPWTLVWSDGFVQTDVTTNVATRAVAPTNTTVYRVTSVSDVSCTSTSSGSATITLNSVPTVTLNPTNRTVCSGTSVSFVSRANSAATVRWQVSSDNGVTYTNINGATGTNYAFTSATNQNGNFYRAVFSNACGTATSAVAVLTVNPAPAPIIVGSSKVCASATGNTAYVTNIPAGATIAWTITAGTLTSPANGTNITYTSPANGTFQLRVNVTIPGGCSGAATNSITVVSPSTTTIEGWANNPGRPGTYLTWQGDLNNGKHRYSEGKAIPFRLSMPNRCGGAAWCVTIEFDFEKSGTYMFDSLATYNATEASVNGFECAGITCGSPVTTFPIPIDPSLPAGAQLLNQFFTVYGGAITNVSAYTTAGGTKRITLTGYTATGGAQDVVILFGGHLARENEWGFLHGAAHYSGSSGTMAAALCSENLSSHKVPVNPGDIVIEADVMVAKTSSPNPVCVSNVLTYTLHITNLGPNQATSVTVTDSLPREVIFISSTPAGTLSGTNLIVSLGTMDAGSNATVMIQVLVSNTAPGVLTNIARVGAASPTDPFKPNNSFTNLTLVNRQLAFASQPSSMVLCPGGNGVFSVTVTGSPPIVYQWFRDGVAIPGATNSQYSITNVTAGDAGNYFVTAMGPCNSATSQVAVLTVSTPVSTTPLTSLVRCPGDSASFTTVISGTGPYAIVWLKNGVVIPDATNATLTISPVTPSSAGTYCVEISGACGSATNCATLAVNDLTTATPLANQTACPSNNVTFAVNASGTGPFVFQWYHNSNAIAGATNSVLVLTNVTTNDAGVYAVVVAGACNPVTNSATLTINGDGAATGLVPLTKCPGETATFATTATGTGPFTFVWRKDGNIIPGETNNALVLTNVSAADAGVFSVEVQGACAGASSSAALTVNTNTTATALGDAVACPGSDVLFATTPGGTGPFAFVWRKGGVELPGETNSSLLVTNVSANEAGLYTVEVTGACNAVTNSATLTVSLEPALTPLLNTTSCPNRTVTFATTANGTGPFAFIWRKDGVEIIGETNSALVLPSVTASDAGTYTVEVTSACGSATNSAVLVVLEDLAATALTSLTRCEGESAAFTTVASGSGPFAFVWRKDGNVMAGETNASLVIATVSTNDAGVYSVEVTGACGGITNSATLVVNRLTTATPLADVTACAGESATFGTTADGTGPFTFVWRKDGGVLVDQTNSALVLSNLTAGDAGTYSVEVSGACNTVTNSAVLVVRELTSATPLSDAVRCEGDSVTFGTVGAGAGPLVFRWLKDGVAIPDATNSTLSLTNLTLSDAGTYSVEVQGACNAVTNTAVLTVNQLTTATPLASLAKCEGSSALFPSTVSGTGPFTFVWRKDGVVLPGETNASLFLPSVSSNSVGVYSLEVYGACNAVTNTASLTLNAPTTATPLDDQTVCAGGTAVFGTIANGSGPFDYLWFKDGVWLDGETNSSLTLTNVTDAAAGTYSVEVIGTCNTVTNRAQLFVTEQISATPLTDLALCSGGVATFATTATGAGPFTYVWRKDAQLLVGETNASLTIDPVTEGNAGTYSVEVFGACNTVTNTATLAVLSATTATPLADRAHCVGDTATFATTPSGTGPFTFVWRKNGGLLSETNGALSFLISSTDDAGVYSVEVAGQCNAVTNSATLTISEPTSAGAISNETRCAGGSVTFTALPSGTGPYTYAWRKGTNYLAGQTNVTLELVNLTTSDAGVYTVEIGGACNHASSSATLNVSTQPSATPLTNQTRCATESVTFSTTVGGIGPFTYAWRKGTNYLPGQFTSTLTLTNLRTADAGTYTVEVTGGCGTATNSATLTVLARTSATPLANQNRCVGANANFSTLVSGAGPFTYVWRKDGVLLPGRTNSNTTITNLTPSDAGVYCVEITGRCNTLTNCATLTVNTIPVVSGLTNQLVCPGGTATLVAQVSGVGNYTYVWRRNGFVLVGQTSNVLVVANVTASRVGTYSLEVNSICRNVTNSMVLGMKTNVSIAPIPDVTQCEGRSVTFTADAAGTGPFVFQWQKDDVAIPGATNGAYTIASVTLADAGVYSVQVGGECSSTNASTTLRVEPFTYATPLQDVTLCEGGFARFSTTITGGGDPIEIVWRKNGNIIPGQNGSTLEFPNAQPSDSGFYTVEVTGCSSVTNTAVLTVNERLRSTMETNKLVCSCADLILGPAITGTGPFTYVWRKDGVVIEWATNLALNIGKAITTSPGVYEIEIYGPCNNVTNRITVQLIEDSKGWYAAATPISIAPVGTATPYPSRIFVQCAPRTVSEMTVTLDGLSHTFPDDVDILLVSPSGRAVKLMSDAGGKNGNILNGVTLTFDDTAPSMLPDEQLITSGVYRPTDYASLEEGAHDGFPAPAPPPSAGTIGELLADDPNGYWSLHVKDDNTGDAGSISGGWRLSFGRRDYVFLNVFLSEPQMLPSGAFEMQLNGEPNTTYFLEASTNLQQWDVIQTNTLSSVSMKLTDPTAPQFNYRFYRVSGCRD